MINILVVDDEPVSADGISMYLQENGESDWVVRTAYNGVQALEMAKQRVDILLSDIRMPGMDGFQVQEKIREIWPMSRCVFLTSINQVDYIQRAMRSGAAVDYVLKIEGEKVILDAVMKAVEVQKKDLHTREMLQKAEEEMRAIRPMQQKELVLSLLRGTYILGNFSRRFRELEFALDAGQPVLLILGKVGEELTTKDTSDFDISVFVLNNILEKYFWPVYRIYTVSLGEQRFAVLLQNVSFLENRDARHVFSMMEPVQQTFRQAGGTASFAVDDSFCRWDELHTHYQSLNAVLERNLPMEESLVLRTSLDQLPENSPSEALYQLRALLENGSLEGAAEALQKIESPVTVRGKIDLYRKLLKLLLAAIDAQENAEELYRGLHIPTLQTDDKGWNAMQSEFAAVLRRLAVSENTPSGRMEQAVDKVCKYVQDHLEEDLSLVRLADMADLSSSYLSRIFKIVKGIGYNEFVVECRMEQAAQLLHETNLSLANIATQMGYMSSSYFIRTFRKKFGMTPMEYRRNDKNISLIQ